MNNDLHTYLGRDDDNTPIGQKIDDSKALSRIITGGQSSKGIYKIRLFVDSKKMYSGELDNFFPLDLINK
ncbi:MAG: Integral membrane sensor signal transduction histidine kinase, partial [Candidatus Uhrbacteria bacterium GW2011_GWD2_52_7]